MTTRDERRSQLDRLAKKQLESLCRTGIKAPDGRVVELLDMTGRRRDELIRRILDIQFPPAAG